MQVAGVIRQTVVAGAVTGLVLGTDPRQSQSVCPILLTLGGGTSGGKSQARLSLSATTVSFFPSSCQCEGPETIDCITVTTVTTTTKLPNI